MSDAAENFGGVVVRGHVGTAAFGCPPGAARPHALARRNRRVTTVAINVEERPFRAASIIRRLLGFSPGGHAS